ncbi:MAG: sigma 54-interacting transcriptional regulator [Deltaproteobacteria bacterium]|nr:sigma 54-interacting transcriptional regulator [Deltaproteobacteria bacterium]
MFTHLSTHLKDIQKDAQKCAEAISSALQIETEIVDDELTVIAGTGLYLNEIGSKEEHGDINAGFLYGRTITSMTPCIVTDTSKESMYDPNAMLGPIPELAEICCPIALNGKALGAIGLVAFNKSQQLFLIERQKELVEFISLMAELLASKAAEMLSKQKQIIAKNQLRTIIEAIDQGVMAIDRKGIIRHCNGVGATMIRKSKKELVGRPIDTILKGSPLPEVLKTGKGYDGREETYHNLNHEMHFLVTAKPILGDSQVEGVVTTFRDISEVRKQAYNIMATERIVGVDSILGESPQIRQLRERSRQIAKSNSTVLITGESGTGKGLIATAIHYSGARKNGPFISINCAAIPDELLESELFGYTEGAFSGARKGGKPGKFELAEGGTICLDEIGDMPLRLQPKLLQVLQSRTVERLGGIKQVKVDVRVIASTNRDLEQMIIDREFREDLFYRLNVIPLHTTPFRERKEDILLLLEHFLTKCCHEEETAAKKLSPEVKNILLSYQWPGNVRELENTVEYMVSLESGDTITLNSIPPRIRKAIESGDVSNKPLSVLLEDYEKDLLKKKLDQLGGTPGQIEELGKTLQISRATLYRKLKKYGFLA